MRHLPGAFLPRHKSLLDKLMEFGIILLACSSLVAQKVTPGAGGTAVIGLTADFDSFNELNAADSDALQVIQNMLFMSLTALDEHLQFTPQLASSWEFSHGDSVLTYHLRPDVFWSDGAPTTAEDVQFTCLRAIDPEVAYPASSRFDLVDSVVVVDTFQVRFYFKRPYPDALYDTQIPILPAHLLRNIPPKELTDARFNRQPVGNGPFVLTQWDANRRVIFEANPRFVTGRPNLDKVVFVIIPNETVLLTELLNGTLDMVPSLSPQQFTQIPLDSSVRPVRYAGKGFTFIGWNMRRPLFNRKTRQALTCAIDREEIIATLLEGMAVPARGPLMPFSWAYDRELPPPTYQPEKARRLLAEEGWSDSDGDGVLDRAGRPLTFSIKTNAGNQLRRDVLVMVQAQLKKLGVEAQIETVDWNLLIEQVFQNKDFDALLLGWDADFTVNPTDLWHSQAIENGYNFVSYQNPRVDYLLETARNTPRQERAKPLWDEFQKTIVEDAPYTFLFIPDKLAGVRRRLQGVQMDARGFLAGIARWRIAAKPAGAENSSGN